MNPNLKTCPHCGVMVVPQPDGTCNACSRNFNDPPAEPLRKRSPRPVVVVYQERKQSFALVGTLSAMLFVIGLVPLLGVIPLDYAGVVPGVGGFFWFAAHLWLSDTVSDGDFLRGRVCLYIPFLFVFYIEDTWREARGPLLLWTASLFCLLMGLVGMR